MLVLKERLYILTFETKELKGKLRLKIAQGKEEIIDTFRNSFNEQTPHRRLDSIPMISCSLMTWGVPRAPKVAAGCSILPCC
jgi:hypothetical protein